ncbi:MAG TPA: class I SAM-dependent methyltransferase [Gemmatimonadales bacterium]|nr:class I SAM-dependent methyltransferase [Gemmatimonadales bacterium]
MIRSCLIALTIPAILAAQETAAPRRSPDVHFVPTDAAMVRAMLRVAQVGKQDLVYDLGCGDGRIVITAVKRYGARGVCVDIDPARIAESKRNADTAGVARRIRFHEGDLFEMDLSDATVVTLYLLPALNVRLRPKLFRELRPGSRVVSNSFDMGDWKADSTLQVQPAAQFFNYAYYWVIPADVAGRWEVNLTKGGSAGTQEPYLLQLEQRYQMLTGKATRGDREVVVSGASMTGDRLSFTLVDSADGQPRTLRFSGQVTGEKASGTVKGLPGQRSGSWSAVRTERGPRPELEEEKTGEPAGGE